MSLFLLIGCTAAYTPPPLTTQHPAHPEAMAAPAPPPSTTLAYGPADLPTPQPTSSMAQQEMPQGIQGAQGMHHEMPQGMHQGMQGAHASTQTSPPAVVGEGKVMAVVPGSSQVVVDHKAIPGVMGAMTMGYRVAPASLLEGVQAGDMIRFTMDPQQQVITTIEKLHE
jgi:Cu/Ag efflux protein CusF